MAKGTQHKVNPPGQQSDARHQGQPSNAPRPGRNPSRPAGNERSHPLNRPIKGGDTSLAPGGSKMGKHSRYEKCSVIESPLQKFHDVSGLALAQKSKGQQVETKASGDSIVGT
jgi:hypothetical protein